ncbi:MAG: HpaII family restriction endonuclease, partial [Prevotellaceae bacterium]|nr:HpaII family restriction endonuclease [Candidatus Faecinaster equi]
MALSGNKGEWSEIYTLFKLLGDGKVHAGDADMNKLDLYYPILNIIREESKRYEYRPNADQHIVVIDEDGK